MEIRGVNKSIKPRGRAVWQAKLARARLRLACGRTAANGAPPGLNAFIHAPGFSSPTICELNINSMCGAESRIRF